MRIFRLVSCLMLLVPGMALAETLYVRAQPSVALLSSPALEATVTRRLTPGDSISVLSRDTGYVQVQTADGTQGWLRESDVTDTVPPAQRVAALEQETAGLQRQLAAAQNSLRSTQAELRQARQAAETARDAGQGKAADLESENLALQETLATRQQEIDRLQQRVAELEMAQEASRLLTATRPTVSESIARRYSAREMLAFAGSGVLLAMLGMWAGSSASRRRLRRRYNGLEL